ncbi:hypothetical protein BDV96DRAFT_684861 [Lophiotrema nucula]|uniref:Uncharacterized protein n=1 Tax=Lophiotrema nucula TaxID=690887 RepID=A0A6A5ZG44_9PLEO|nr:hypothetical protein BDV96DRAFT_684861 [Lophiotrema nucula]
MADTSKTANIARKDQSTFEKLHLELRQTVYHRFFAHDKHSISFCLSKGDTSSDDVPKLVTTWIPFDNDFPLPTPRGENQSLPRGSQYLWLLAMMDRADVRLVFDALDDLLLLKLAGAIPINRRHIIKHVYISKFTFSKNGARQRTDIILRVLLTEFPSLELLDMSIDPLELFNIGELGLGKSAVEDSWRTAYPESVDALLNGLIPKHVIGIADQFAHLGRTRDVDICLNCKYFMHRTSSTQFSYRDVPGDVRRSLWHFVARSFHAHVPAKGILKMWGRQMNWYFFELEFPSFTGQQRSGIE